MYRILLLSIAALLPYLPHAQCINTFPYSEDFESTNGNWNSGGTSNDWAWGAVSKPVIAQAASGSKCWVTGGLTSSFYNLGESSFVQSPCFDFSSLQSPYITFNIFWETEKTYDGAVFQYSLNGGANWQNVGSTGDATDCLNANWFNSSNVNYLNGLASPREGWTGNRQATNGSCQGGNGSNSWKLATHCMPYLAGKASVIFRFAFGAGTQCNNYDGFAFDDITISEAPVPVIDFTSLCQNNTFSFTGSTTLCPNQFSWLFGDGNTGTGLTTSHTYSGPGNYNVTFTAGGSCSVPVNITKTIQVASATITTTDVTCNNRTDGSATVALNAAGNYSFIWSTNPVQTSQTAVQLSAGSYSVTVSAPGMCDISASAAVGLRQPSAYFNYQNISCKGNNDGEVEITAIGGTSPYTYKWSSGDSTAKVSGLSVGSYWVTVSDANNCSISDSVILEKETCPTEVYFPTAFSPNGDGENDLFKATSFADVKKFQMQVYNRWGELVFVSTNIHSGWDGVYQGIQQPLSVYVWYSEYVLSDGSKHVRSGNVTLVR